MRRSKKMKNCILKFVSAMMLVAVSNLTIAAETTIAPADTLEQLLKNVKDANNKETLINKKRLEEFRKALSRQDQLLADAKRRLAAEEATSERLKTEFAANELTIAESEKAMTLKLGNMGEMNGVVRQVSGDTVARIASSNISAQYPNREKPVKAMVESKKLPQIPDLRLLWSTIMDEMTQSSKITKFTTEVTARDGSPAEREVIRVGSFNLLSNGEYLIYDAGTGTLKELLRQPDASFLDMIAKYSQSSSAAPLAIDPSRGNLLSLIVEKNTLGERYDQGGPVGLVITAVLIIGLLLALVRFFMLTGSEMRIKSQMKSATPGKNPLGRIMAVYLANKDADVENMELKLDEAVLKETPRLEMGVTFIKVLSAISPLLGLLGTVTGMIETFQNITLFGTGDPKLMAGGISTALITTVLGIIAAIPLILAHAIVSGKSKKLVTILEQQSAGFIATHAEREGAK
jgi:biopolymer transport protein ExbB